MKFLPKSLTNSAPLIMVASVGLYSFYPPLTNLLLDRIPPFLLALIIHGSAALATGTLVVIGYREYARIVAPVLKMTRAARLFLIFVIGSGFLIVLDSLFLYYALVQSDRFDITAILFFETWPVVFFIIDAFFVGRSRLTVTARDYMLVFITFFGFVTLMIQGVDVVDWLLFDNNVVDIAILAGLGGILMALTVFFRRVALLRLSDVVSEAKLEKFPDFRLAVTVEFVGRSVAAVLFLVVVLVFGGPVPSVSSGDLMLAFVVGAVTLAGGGVLYHLSVFKAPNAAITALWYLMPVGSLVIIALLQERFINEYEAISAIMIVSANILIGLRHPLTSSFNLLYLFTIIAGLSCVFLPYVSFSEYFATVSVATIFYALLGTYALSRTTESTRDKGLEMMRLQQALRKAFESARTPDVGAKLARLGAIILNALRHEPRIPRDQYRLQLEIGELKLEGTADGERPSSADVDEAFVAAERLALFIGEKISGGEYVVIALLALTNVMAIIFLRDAGLIYDLFAFALSVAAAFLLFLIYGQDRHPFLRADYYLTFRKLRNLVRKHAPIQGAVDRRDNDTETVHNRLNFLSSMAIFGFVFAGFTYALIYQNSTTITLPEVSPAGPFVQGEARRPIGIGAPNWPAAQIKAEVLKVVGERYLAADVAIYRQSNEKIFESMGSADGRIDVHPDVWEANLGDLVRRYVRGLGTVHLTEPASEGRQGLCYIGSPASGKSPLSIGDLTDEDVVRSFDVDDEVAPDGGMKGEMWAGAKGWASSRIEEVRAKAYGYASDYNVLEFDEKLLLNALRRYRDIGQPFLFFCYKPHFIFDEFDATLVEENGSDPVVWREIITAATRGGAPPDGGTAWPVSDIVMAYSTRLESSAPNFVDLLENFSVSDEVLNRWSYDMVVGHMSPRDIAEQWVDANEDVVLKWLLPWPKEERRP